MGFRRLPGHSGGGPGPRREGDVRVGRSGEIPHRRRRLFEGGTGLRTLIPAILVRLATEPGRVNRAGAGGRNAAVDGGPARKPVIGEWTLKFSWGAESGIGEYSARWSSGKQSVIIRSWSQDKNGRFELTELLGWDAKAKELLSLTFSSRSEHGYLHWQTWSKDKWTGRGTGWWDGKDWDSPITVEWKNSEFRYEDISPQDSPLPDRSRSRRKLWNGRLCQGPQGRAL